MYVCTCIHAYSKVIFSAEPSDWQTNWYSTVIANNRNSVLSLVVSQMADPTQFWSAIFMFCLENGRWQAVTVFLALGLDI